MKSVLISIRPKWCEKIASGEKTIEVRKSRPKIEMPFKCYIYQTTKKVDEILEEYDSKFNLLRRKKTLKKFMGKVIGEFICDKVDEYTFSHYEAEYRVTHVEQNAMCLNQPELIHYGKGKMLYGWHISDLKIYDKPRELSDFLKPCPDTFHYCTICKHCVKIIPPDEEEYALYHGGQYDYWEEHCTNRLTSPPQSWRYVEDLREE